jgi:hypothetical protein
MMKNKRKPGYYIKRWKLIAALVRGGSITK